jgi:biopolymer transport protein ExbD
MALVRPSRPQARVTLVPLIDVLFILLVYFMVTSVYLDLDMIPAAGGDPVETLPETDAPAAAEDGAGTPDSPDGAASPPGALLVRIAPDGAMVLRGARLGPADLEARLAEEVARRPGLDVVLLPSPRAPVQALATALDTLARAGITRSRVLQLEGE